MHLRRGADHGASATRSRSSAGTTTSGATPTGSSTSSRSSARPCTGLRSCARIDDLDDSRGRAGPGPARDLNVPLDRRRRRDDHRRRPDPGQRCRRSRALADARRARRRRAPTSAGRRARPAASVLAARRSPPGWASCSGAPVRVRRRHRRARPPQRRRRRTRRRRRRAAGEPAVRRRGDQQGRRRARAPSPTSSPRSADLYVSDGFGVVHRKQASVYDVAAAAAARRRRAGAGRGRGAAAGSPATPTGPTPSCSAGRRCPTSSASSTTCWRRSTACSSAAACASRSSPRRATRSATRCSRPTRSTPCAGYLPSGRGRGVELVLPVDVVVADAFAADADHDVVAADAIAGRPDGPRHRPATSASCSPTQLADARTVFWNGPMGVFELAPFAAGTRAVAEALTDVDGTHRRRRRRLGRRRPAPRASTRTRFGHISTGGGASPGVPRGQDPARARRPGGLTR